MYECNLQIGQRLGERLGGAGRGLEVEDFRFLDQRTYPIRLPPRCARFAHARDQFRAAAGGNRDGLDRPAPGRQLVDNGNVEIGVDALRERAWNRRRAHDELMRHFTIVAALRAQREALLHAKAVLLIDDDEPKPRETHVFLKQRVRPDHDGRVSLRHLEQRLVARAAGDAPGQRANRYAQRRQPFA